MTTNRWGVYEGTPKKSDSLFPNKFPCGSLILEWAFLENSLVLFTFLRADIDWERRVWGHFGSSEHSKAFLGHSENEFLFISTTQFTGFFSVTRHTSSRSGIEPDNRVTDTGASAVIETELLFFGNIKF